MQTRHIMTLVGGALIAGCASTDEVAESSRTTGQLKAAITISGACEPGLDYSGRCDGATLIWCEADAEHSADCAEQGESCGFQNDEIGFNCLPSGGSTACGDVDYAGLCDGSVLVWCDAGSLHEVDCGDLGKSCGFQDADVGFNCLSSGASSGCGDVDFAGYCDGSVLVWCEEGSLQEVDCGDLGKSCGFQSADVGYNCLSSGGSSGGEGLLSLTEIVSGYPYSVTQDYGPTDFWMDYSYCQSYGNWGGGNVHCGVDLGIPRGTVLRMPGAGVVTMAGGGQFYQDAYNFWAGDLRVELNDGTVVVFGHTSEIHHGIGASPAVGAAIGESGTLNGDHLHLEVRVPDSSCSSGYCTVDPIEFFGW